MASRMLPLFSLLTLLAIQTGLPGAAPTDRRCTVTDKSKAGPDFAVQGEYIGVVVNENVEKKVGLQVIALGSAKFRGVIHWGGLPDAGWDGEEKGTVTGQRKNSSTVLRGNEQAWTITGGSIIVSNAAAQVIGQLKRIERVSPTMGAKPTADAKVLFDGSNAEHFVRGRVTKDKLLQVGTITKMLVHDFHLHLEFRTPYMPNARGQGRGNSGVYIQKRYEVQILDSFGLKGVHNECGGLYRQRKPDLNMCLPPLTWQTYDIDFKAARWEGDQKVANARLTVRHNGVLIHDNVEVPNKTGAGDKESPKPGPIRLQNHSNPVHFRNIWIVEKKPEEEAGCKRRCGLLRRLFRRCRR